MNLNWPKNPEDRFFRHQAQILSNVAKQEILEAKHQFAETSKNIALFCSKGSSAAENNLFLVYLIVLKSRGGGGGRSLPF